MDIVKWFFFLGLGTLAGSFGVVQILILIMYSLPTNKALNDNGLAIDIQKMDKYDKISIIVLSCLTLFLTFFVYLFANSNNWAIYIGAVFFMVFIGRKQLKGNDNNISDYLKRHQRFLVEYNYLDLDEMNNFFIILRGQYATSKQGIGGFLLLYVGAIAFHSYRSFYAITEAMSWLSNPYAVNLMVETDSKIIPFSIIHIIVTVGVISFSAYLIYGIITRKSTIQIVVRNYHFTLIAVSVITFFMASFIPSSLQEMIYLFVIEIVFAILFAIWGILYFNNSKRVKNTYGCKNVDNNNNPIVNNEILE